MPLPRNFPFFSPYPITFEASFQSTMGGGGKFRTDPGFLLRGGSTKFLIRKLRASLVEGEATNRGREAHVNQGRVALEN